MWHQHTQEVLQATASLRGFDPHQYLSFTDAPRKGRYAHAPPAAGRWLESGWIATFWGRQRPTFGPWVPIFAQWNDARHEAIRRYALGYPLDLASSLRTLRAVLRPDVLYLTVCEASVYSCFFMFKNESQKKKAAKI